MSSGASKPPKLPGISDGRLTAGLLFAVVYTLTVHVLNGEPGAAGAWWIVAVPGGGLILSRFFGWKPALAVTLTLAATSQTSWPWSAALAGRPADVLRLTIYAGGAITVLVSLRGMRRALGRTEERYQALAESASDGILITDFEGNYLWANSQASEMFGYDRLEMVDLNLARLIVPEDLRTLPIRGASGKSGAPVLRECRARRKTGEQLTVEMSCRTLMDGRFMAIMRDVTERKRAENEMKASLREKEVLLREIHHRVKNNLQIVSSLLSLQSRSVKDPEALGKFTDSLERIKSIALLHEKLYLSKNLARIDFAEYAPNLVSSLAATYHADQDGVRLETDVKDVSLELETAVPCGLILTELVTNALKYAFPGGAPGRIRIGMERRADDTVCLRVADTGVGMPEGVRNPDSLGLKLVTTLVEQLKGRMEIRRQNGTEVTICFPLRPARTAGGGWEERVEEDERAITADSGR